MSLDLCVSASVYICVMIENEFFVCVHKNKMYMCMPARLRALLKPDPGCPRQTSLEYSTIIIIIMKSINCAGGMLWCNVWYAANENHVVKR